MMTKTQDHVMTRARTRIQASGELKVEWRLSVKVFLGTLGGDPASPFLLLMTMVVVVDDLAEEQRSCDQIQWIKYDLLIPNIPGKSV